MRLWITRPAEDAIDLATALRDAGHEVAVEPLLAIDFMDGPPLDLAGVQALLATSANGVRAFVRRNGQRDLPVLAVGDATARVAREAGFAHVESAAGDVAALAELVQRRLRPGRGALLHVAASEVAGDLAGALAAAGFDYRREILYRARAAERLSDDLTSALRRGALDGVLVFSPRTGRTLVRLLGESGLRSSAGQLICFCLSPAVAAVVAPLIWRRVTVAPQATQAALIADVKAASIRSSVESALNSLSPNSFFAATLDPAHNGRQRRDGGMSSDTKRDGLPDSATPASDSSREHRAQIYETPVPVEAREEAPPAESSADASVPEPTVEVVPPGAETMPSEPVLVESATESKLAQAAEPAKTNADRAWAMNDPHGAEPASLEPELNEPASDRDAVATTSTAKGPDAAAGPAPRTRRSVGRFLWALVVLALVAAAGALAYYGYIEPRQRQMAEAEPLSVQPELDTALEDLEAQQTRLRQQLDALAPRVDAIERTLADLRQSVDTLATPEQAAGGEVVKQLSDSLTQLGDRLTLLEGKTSSAGGLAQQVRSLEASTAVTHDMASKLATTVLAVGQLTQAVAGGEAFTRQLAAVRALGGDDPDIAQAAAQLEPFAATGVQTLAALRVELPRTIDGILRATPATSGETWQDRVVDRMASLVTVRRIGSEAIAGGGVDGAVAAAELALEAGDLQAAVTALERLEAAPAQAAATWLDHAGARLAADRALATLQQRALARLATARG